MAERSKKYIVTRDTPSYFKATGDNYLVPFGYVLHGTVLYGDFAMMVRPPVMVPSNHFRVNDGQIGKGVYLPADAVKLYVSDYGTMTERTAGVGESEPPAEHSSSDEAGKKLAKNITMFLAGVVLFFALKDNIFNSKS